MDRAFEAAAFEVARTRRGLDPDAELPAAAEQALAALASTVEALVPTLGGDWVALQWFAAGLESFAAAADQAAEEQRA